MVDGLECAHIKLVEHNPTIDQLFDIGRHVVGPEAHLRVVGFVGCGATVNEEGGTFTTLKDQVVLYGLRRERQSNLLLKEFLSSC